MSRYFLLHFPHLWLLASLVKVNVSAAPHVSIYRGTSPNIDGTFNATEWSDATSLLTENGTVFTQWTSEFQPVNDKSDLNLDVALAKFDNDAMYFEFVVADDCHYGKDTPFWTPEGNPSANNLTQDGWPWFGDEMELLINARPGNDWQRNLNVAGNASQFQMVVNTIKSRKGGFGVGGLMEGEPRTDAAWQIYRSWIESGAMRAATQMRAGANGYVIEWAIGWECVEIAPGKAFNPQTQTEDQVLGFNIALGDVDQKFQGTWGARCNLTSYLPVLQEILCTAFDTNSG